MGKKEKEFSCIKKKVEMLGDEAFTRMLTNPQGVLGEKLRELSLYKFNNREKGKFGKRVDIYNGGIQKMRTDFSLPDSHPYYDYRKTDKQCWQYITGPSDLSDYYSYGGVSFKYYPELFHVGFLLYQASKELGYNVKDKFPENMEQYKEVKKAYGDSIDRFELAADMISERFANVREEYFYYEEMDEEESELIAEPTTWEIYQLGWYVAYAIECELEPGIVDSFPLENAEYLMRGIYCDLGVGEVGIMEYVRYFLDYLIECYKLEDDSGYKHLIPVLEMVHFSCLSPSEGNTLHAYIFSSENIKKYKDLREINPDSKYVPVMDGLLNKLLDPLNMESDAVGTTLIYYEDECFHTSFYTDKEYVCAYLYFGSYVYGSNDWEGESELGRHGFNPFLKEMRLLFDELLVQYEKECRKKQGRSKKVS